MIFGGTYGELWSLVEYWQFWHASLEFWPIVRVFAAGVPVQHTPTKTGTCPFMRTRQRPGVRIRSG
eukprot:886984-Pyramimonas_sp.AAC.1